MMMNGTISTSSSQLRFFTTTSSSSSSCSIMRHYYYYHQLLRSQTKNYKTFRCATSTPINNTVVTENKKKNNENKKVGSSTSRSQYQIENLTSWLLNQERQGNIDAELTIVLSSISLACKQISSLLQRATISKLTGSQGYINIQGEDQRKLDFIANQVFCDCLRSSGRTGIIASEEEDDPIAIEETYSGNYTVVFDPIDGSSNIDTALTTGSIFGIYVPESGLNSPIDHSLIHSPLVQAKGFSDSSLPSIESR